MTTMDTLLCNDPEVKRMALAALEETRPFGIEDYELAACEG